MDRPGDLRTFAVRNGAAAAAAPAAARPASLADVAAARDNRALSRRASQVFRLESYDEETATYQTEPSGRLSILACTRDRLVEYLMRMNPCVETDEELVHNFLFTYDYVFSSEELLEILRYYFFADDTINSDEGMPIKAVQVFFLGLHETRGAVVSILESWVGARPAVFFGAGALAEPVLQFIALALATPRIEGSMRARLLAVGQSLALGAAQWPPPVTRLNTLAARWDGTLGAASVALGAARAWAEELTLVQHELFLAIAAEELLRLGSDPSDEAYARQAPNVSTLLALTETVTQWVLQCVLGEDTKAKRLAMRDFFLDLAKECRRLNNLNACADVVLSLFMGPVSNLKENDAWKGKSDPFFVEHIEIFTDGRGIRANEIVTTLAPPLVPVIGSFKYWAVQADMKTPLAYPQKANLFNTEKFRMVGKDIRRLRAMQRGAFYFEPRPQIRALLVSMGPKLMSLEALAARSEEIEPMDPALAAALGRGKK